MGNLVQEKDHSRERYIKLVRKSCEDIFDITRFGASIMHRDADTLVVLDIDMISSDHILYLCEMYAGLQICMHKNAKSSSGFEIILTLAHSRAWYSRAEVMHVLLCCVVCVLILTLAQFAQQ